jgi:AcrR family transcriptional regulator
MARRSQTQRSEDTRRLLLDATVECLVERGYAGTTVSAVAERAGLSRGAQIHHFGTRQRLMAAAVEHLAARRLAWVETSASAVPRDDTSQRRALDLLAEALSGPLYAATLELYVAARVDGELREALAPVEQRVTGRLRRLCEELVTSDPLLVRMTLDLLLGRGVGSILGPLRPARQSELLDAWAAMLGSAEASR